MIRPSTLFRTFVPAVVLSIGLLQVSSAVAAPSTAASRVAASQRRLTNLQRLGLIKPGVTVTRPEFIKPAKASKTSAKSRTAAATPIQFEFLRSTFPSDSVYNDLVNFRRGIISDLEAVYGLPAPVQQGSTVRIVGNGVDPDDSSSTGIPNGFQPFANYSGGGTIYYQYNTSLSADENHYLFLRTLLQAYHGPTVMTLDYLNAKTLDPWETAFHDAAALEIMYRSKGKPANFDPGAMTLYILPFYDFMNNPGLGNPFFGPNDLDEPGVIGISDFRAQMAQSAWLKVFAEDENFFNKFNSAYYTAWGPDHTVAGNVSRLKAIAAGVTPTVEGLNFQDWFRQQHALDTSVVVGEKLYLGLLPVPSGFQGDTRSGFDAIAEWLVTNPDGTETPKTGSLIITATDEKGADLTSKSTELKDSRVVTIVDDDESWPGEAIFHVGFSGLGTPDRSRVNVKISGGSSETSTYFPYGVAGNTSSASSFFGGIVGAEAGNLGIAVQGGASQTVAAQRGTWASTLGYPSRASVKTTFTFSGRTVKRNTAWLVPGNDSRSVGFLLEVPPGNNTFTYTVPTGGSTLRMISLPLFPNKTDEADILGIPKADLKLGRYRPSLSSQPVGEGDLPFGINGDRHELYPDISSPMEPGKGYWLGNASGRVLSVQGGQPSQTKPYEVPLSGGWASTNSTTWVATGGWNQIGVPFNKNFDFNAVKVRYGGFSPVPWSTAVTRGWVGAGIWRWKPVGGYERVDTNSKILRPFEGYYVYSRFSRGVSLVFDASAGTAAVAAVKGWQLGFVASTTQHRDASNTIGVSAERIPAAKPPTGAKVVTLRFLTSGSGEDQSGAGTATGWADSYLTALENSGQWNFLVDGTTTGQRVTVSWGSTSQVPLDLKLRLVDVLTGKATAVTEGGYHTFTSQGKPRRFRIEATRVPKPSISVSKLPSAGYKVTVTANMVFAGRVEIRRDGQTYRVLRNGEFPKGTSTFTWDGRNTQGKAVAPGTYHAWIIPSGENGIQVPFAVQ